MKRFDAGSAVEVRADGTEDREPALELRGVTKWFADGEHDRVGALRDVSLALRPGELTAVMGPSGSGKSTLIRLAAGLEVPDAGEVLVAGEVLRSRDRAGWAAARRRAIGVVHQRLDLVPTLSALDNVALPLELDGVPRRAARLAAVEALASVGLGELAGRRPAALSGGQQQRVAIARALVGPRRVLLADEPTGALDSVQGEQIVRLLAARAEAGAAVLLVTHDSRLASWADRIVELRDGELVDPRADRRVAGTGGGPATGSSGSPIVDGVPR